MTRPTAAELSKTPTRVCTRCAKRKPVAAFPVTADDGRPSGFRVHPWCGDCKCAYARSYYRARSAGLRIIAALAESRP